MHTDRVFLLADCSPLQWRHERDGISNNRCLDYLLNRWFRRRSKKTSKLRVIGHCEGNPSVTDGFPSQRASYVENVSIWWRRHAHPVGLLHQHWNNLTIAPVPVKQPWRIWLKRSHRSLRNSYNHNETRHSKPHDDVIKWKHFPRTWPFVRGIHRSRWIPHTKASDAELWCFLWSASE